MNTLKKVSLLYLLFPYIIYYLGWLKLPLALFVSLTIALLFYLLCRQDDSENSKWKEDIDFIFPKYKCFLILCSGVILIVWISLSGVGGLGYQTSDYIKHNAILFDLVNEKWPISFENSHSWLVYYIGYYLPPALIGKLFNSYFIAEMSTIVWASIGIVLSIIWWLRLVGQRLILSILIFIFFSGLDSLGQLLLHGSFESAKYIEWWSRLAFGDWQTRIWQYSSNTTHLFWAPQHAIPAWLAAPMIVKSLESRNNRSIAYVLAAAATLLWSPFVTIGLLPFVLHNLIRDRHQLKRVLIFSPLLVLFEIPVIMYFLSQNSNIPWFMVYSHYDFDKIVYNHVLFITLEVLIFIPFLRSYWKNPACLISLGILLLLPFIKGGMNNDLMLRASIPALYCLALFFTRSFNHHQGFSFLKIGMIGILLIGAITPLKEFSRSIRNYSYNVDPVHVMNVHPLTSIQYTGLKTSFLFKESNTYPLIDKPVSLSSNVVIYDVFIDNYLHDPSLKTVFITIEFKEPFAENQLCLLNNADQKEFKVSSKQAWRPNHKITIWTKIIQDKPISRLLIGACNQSFPNKEIKLRFKALK